LLKGFCVEFSLLISPSYFKIHLYAKTIRFIKK
jgi:hypothetical protein